MEDIIMESVENLNGNVSQKIMSCKGGHDENQQVPSKTLPKLFYSRDLLIKLKNHPSSKEKPAIFDDLDRVKNGMWDPEHWHSRTAKEPKRSNSGTVVGAGNKEDQQEKKRGKEEGDEFCFTPQRRSFVSGCHVVRRQDAEPAVPPVVTESVRESTLPARRVGSGRLTGRDVEPAPVPAKEPRDRREPLRAPAPQRERTFDREPQRNERGNERNDRHDRNERNERSERNGRTFQPSRADPRDKDPAEKDRRNFDRSGYDRDYSGRGDRGDRYNSRRKNEDDTPEWFFGGPSSQHDTIELRGFDEEKDRKQNSKAPIRKESNKERQQSSGAKKSEEPPTSSSRPGSGLSGKVVKEDQPLKTEAPKRKSPVNQDKMDFNIEDFLKMDGDLNGLGLGPTESEETSRGSKASRWFGKTSDLPEASKPPATENVKPDHSTNQDAARSLLEMLQKGSQQQQSVEHKKIVTAEELERSSGKYSNNERSSDDGMTVFNKLLAQVQESTTKPHSVMNSAPTEQDILANLLGKQMKIEAQPPQPVQHHAQQTHQDALAKFLQQQQSNQMHHPNTQQHNTHQMLQQPQINHLHHQQQQSHLFSMHSEQPHSDVHSMMRDLANGHPQTLNQLHMMTMQKQHQQQQQQLQQQQQQQLQQYQQQQQQQQQHQQQQQQQRQAYVGSPQQSVAKQSASSSSPLSFTPTAVMRKMGAEKDKAKAASLDKGDGAETGMGTTSSPPASQSSVTSNRLTGRTASQVQGASRVSNQMRMNDVPVVQQQQQLLTGRPLVKGQESMLPFQQQQQQQSQQAGNRPFGLASASNAAITGVAVKMLEQQQQHQLLAAAVAASANQTQQQLKQQILQQQQQQQQRTSPLQQSLLAFAAGGLQSNMALQNRGIPTNVPVGNRTHFRPIHPQPMIPPISGYSPYMGNQASLQTGQSRLPTNVGSSSNQFYGISPASNIRGQAQGLNALAALQQQAFSGNRSPNMLQGGNSLSRWFPPEIFSQTGSGQMPTLPPMPSQKILSLEELERLHTSPMSH